MADFLSLEERPVNYDQKVQLKFEIAIHHDASEMGFGFHIRNNEGIDVLYSSSGVGVELLKDLKANTKVVITNDFKLDLVQGFYDCRCFIYTH